MSRAGGMGAALQASAAVVDDAVRRPPSRIAAMASGLDAELLQPRAVERERVVLLPLPRARPAGRLLGGIGARVAAVAVGQALDQRRAELKPSDVSASAGKKTTIQAQASTTKGGRR